MSDHEDRYIEYLGEHDSGFLGGAPEIGLEKLRHAGIIDVTCIGDRDRRYMKVSYERMAAKKPVRKTAKVTIKNKFYVAARRVTAAGDTWSKPTLTKALEHARELLDKDSSLDYCAVVKIIRVVRRKPVETVVETV